MSIVRGDRGTITALPRMLAPMLARTVRWFMAPLGVGALAVACGPPEASPTEATPASASDGKAAATPGVVGEAASHLQRSFALEQQGDLAGAEVEANAAVAAGGGRDATLQQTKLAILGQRYDAAVAPLEALVQADPEDAAAQYNLALVRHHQGDYNRARNGYLAALRSDSRYADARYNLAELCLSHGFADEARHHAAKFRTAFPQDPRGADLERRVGGVGAAGPVGAPVPSPPSPLGP
jgi:tetratricopeptide (TPR) repeat protein